MLVLGVGEAEAEIAADWLWGLGAIAIEERSTIGVSDVGADGPITLVAGFADTDAAAAAQSAIGERWPSRFEVPPDESEWRDVWLRHLSPVDVGPLIIHPPWRKPSPAPGLRCISIDPGQAFGSGHHPSTQLAVLAIDELVAEGDVVLDVGCGTGVLAIAAIALGARTATGIDLDDDIIDIAQANADTNVMSGAIDFSTTPLASVSDRFDLVVANITSRSLAPLVPDIIAAADRSIIVSGLLADQREFLEDTFGWPASQAWSDDEWMALRFEAP